MTLVPTSILADETVQPDNAIDVDLDDYLPESYISENKVDLITERDDTLLSDGLPNDIASSDNDYDIFDGFMGINALSNEFGIMAAESYLDNNLGVFALPFEVTDAVSNPDCSVLFISSKQNKMVYRVDTNDFP